MEINIGICDDSREQLDLIEAYLERFPENRNIHIITALNGVAFLKKLQSHPIDIALLDVEMPELNGIQIGTEIKRQFPETIIIFITGFKNYALEAFQLESFQYLIKPITPEQFYSTIEKTIQRLKERRSYLKNERLFTITNRDEWIAVPLDQIYYFERQLRKIVLVTSTRTYEFIDSLKVVMSRLEQLHQGEFKRCHHGFIVNCSKIWEIKEWDIVFRSINKTIPVSRRYRGEIVAVLEKNLFQDR